MTSPDSKSKQCFSRLLARADETLKIHAREHLQENNGVPDLPEKIKNSSFCFIYRNRSTLHLNSCNF